MLWWLLATLLSITAAQEWKYANLFGTDLTLQANGGGVTTNTTVVNPGGVLSFPSPTVVIGTGAEQEPKDSYLKPWTNYVLAGRDFATMSTSSAKFMVVSAGPEAEVLLRRVKDDGSEKTRDRKLAPNEVWYVELGDQWSWAYLEITSTADVLVVKAANDEFVSLVPTAQTIYGQCSPTCRILITGGDKTLPIKRTCTNNSVADVQAGFFHDSPEYNGETCKWEAPAGAAISGFAYGEGGAANNDVSFIPDTYFHYITPVPTDLDYLLLIGTSSAVCTYGGSNSVTLAGSDGVYATRIDSLSEGDVVECDMLVTAVGSARCPSGMSSCVGQDINLLSAPLNGIFTPTTTSATGTTTSLSTTTSATSTTTSSTASTVTTASTTSTTSATTTSTSSSSTTSTMTTSITTSTSTTSTSTTSTSSTSTATTSTTPTSTATTSSTTTSTDTTSTTATSTVTTSSATTSTTSSATTSTTSITSSTTMSTTSSTSTTVSATTYTTTTTTTNTTTSTVTTTTSTATAADTAAAAAAALVNRVEAAEASLVNALAGNKTTVTQKVDGLTLVAAKLDPAALAASEGSLSIPLDDSDVGVAVPTSLFAGLGLGAEEPVVLTAASIDPTSLAFTGGEDDKPEAQVVVASAVSINVFSLGGKRFSVNGLQDPIVVTLPANSSEGLQCAYWDEESSSWATKGVKLGSLVGGIAECKSTHLTLFAAIYRGFVNTLACSQVALLNAESIKEVGKAGWYGTTGAQVFGFILATFVLLLLLAACLDWCRWKHGRTSDKHLLIPLRGKKQEEQTQEDRNVEEMEEGRGSRMCAAGCMVCGPMCLLDWCRSSGAVRDAIDEVFSQWAEYFGEIRDLIEGLVEGLDLCSCTLPRVMVLVHRLMCTTLVTSARRQASVSCGISWDTSSLLMEDENLLDVVQSQRAPKSTVDPPANGEGRSVSMATLAREESWGDLHRDVEAKLEAVMEAATRCSSLPGTVWRLFLHQNPLIASLVHCPLTSCKMRVLLFTVDVIGAVLLTTLFYSATGVPTRRTRSSCEFEKPFEVIGRIIAIGTASTLAAGFPAAILASLCTRTVKKVDYEGCPEWNRQLRVWRVQDTAMWILGFLYLCFSVFFVSIFLANTDQEDHTDWLLGIVISMVEDLVLIPLAVSLALASLSTLCLQLVSSRRRVTKKELISDLNLKFKREVNMSVSVGVI